MTNQRVEGALNSNFESWAQNRSRNARQIDIDKGGPFGYQFDPNFYVSNTGYTPRNIIALLVEYPRGFDFLPQPEKSIAALRSLIETQSKNITGLRTGVNVESSERPIGQGGHQMRDPTNVTEEISEPEHVWDERHGRPIHNFFQFYIRNLIQEPITGQPGLMNISPEVASGEDPQDLLADMYSFTTLYIEPDPLRRYVTEAWLVTNMYPTTSGTIESQFDPEAGQDVPEITVPFTGIPVVSQGVRNFAQNKLDEINYVNAGPMQRPFWPDGIDSDITAAERGYMENLSASASEGEEVATNSEA